jgi:hypothetical protein
MSVIFRAFRKFRKGLDRLFDRLFLDGLIEACIYRELVSGYGQAGLGTLTYKCKLGLTEDYRRADIGGILSICKKADTCPYYTSKSRSFSDRRRLEEKEV